MSGIAGEIGDRQFITSDLSRVEKMCDAIRHRGPETEHCYHSPNDERSYGVNLGLRVRSAFDWGLVDQIPKEQDATQVFIVFDGEIYNHREIVRLIGNADRMKTDYDYEALWRSWCVWGDDVIRTIDGEFAFAVWDQRIETLFLVRDRMGCKPLYYFYARERNVLLFASEIKAILANPLYYEFVEQSRRLNFDAIFDFVCLQYCPEPQTAFRGISAVLPGDVLRFTPGSKKFEIGPYSRLEDHIIQLSESDPQTVNLIESSVRNAVYKRLEGDVTPGIYLSGGLDSSIVTAIAKEKIEELHTFAVGFEETGFNELEYAKMAADHFKTIHHPMMVKEIDFYETTKRIVDQYDQPFGDCSAIPTMLLNQHASNYIAVALTGDGADEAFGGYSRYWLSQTGDPESYIRNLMVWGPPQRAQILNPLMQANVVDTNSTQHFLLSHVNPNRDQIANMLTIDTHTYLVNDCIVKMERAAAANSIDLRSPFLDPRVFGIAHGIPSSEKVGPDSGKQILKDVFADLIPEAIILREKRGFAVPVGQWFRRSDGLKLLCETILRESFGEFGIFSRDNVRDIASQHVRGQINVGHSLWCLVVLDLWLQKHFG